MHFHFGIILMLCCFANTITAQKKGHKTVILRGEKYFIYPENFSKKWSFPSSVAFGDDLQDGKWVLYFKEDPKKIASLFEIKDKVLYGHIRDFYFDGKLCFEGYYYQGVDTFFKYWFKNGKLEETGRQVPITYNAGTSDEFIEGRYKGQKFVWYENGQLKSEENYNNIGDKHGVRNDYYLNGQKSNQYFYKNGNKDSVWTDWYNNGQLHKTWRYRNDTFVNQSPYTCYHENGSVAATGNLVDETPIGEWKFYFPNGKLRAVGSFDTLLYCYDDDCRPRSMSFKTGEWKYFYTNGKLAAQGSFAISEKYYELVYTQETGWKYWNNKGQLISEKDFQQQKLFKTEGYGITYWSF